MSFLYLVPILRLSLVNLSYLILYYLSCARLMECKSGVQGVKELAEEGTPIEVVEGDGDNTMLAHIKSDLNETLKKRFDRNHVVKNIGKHLYAIKKLS